VTLGEVLISVWRQAIEEGRDTVEFEGERFPVKATRAKKLRTVEFRFGDHRLAGIFW